MCQAKMNKTDKNLFPHGVYMLGGEGGPSHNLLENK